MRRAAAPRTVLSTAQILHGKPERTTRSPVCDVFDVIQASRLDARALAIVLNCKSRLAAETIYLAWEKSSAAFEQAADEQLAGVPEAIKARERSALAKRPDICRQPTYRGTAQPIEPARRQRWHALIYHSLNGPAPVSQRAGSG